MKVYREAKKSIKKLENIVGLIECFDSVRKGHFHAQSKLIKMLSDLKDCRSELRFVKKDLQKAISIVKSSRQKRFKAIMKFTNIVQLICLQYFILTAGLSFIIRLQPEIFEKLGAARILFTFPVMFLMFTLAISFLVMQRYVKKKIKTFNDERAKSKGRDRRLKVMTQKFIDMLGKEITKLEEDPKKFRFRIYHKDYERIQVVKKPGAMSNYYVAIVDTKRNA